MLSIAISGCNAWDTLPASQKSLLPQTRMSRDTVVLEMLTIALPESFTQEEVTRLWSQLDEQHLDRDLRRRMAENGFRCGLMGTEVPDNIRELLDQQATSAVDRWRQMESVRENSIGHRRLQARAGQRYEVVASPTRDTCTVLASREGRLTGETLYNAQCRFGLRSHPRGDGNVRIELTPEIHHGPLEQKWTGNDGAFQPIVARKKQIFDELKIDTVLHPGEILLLTQSSEPKGLGRLFFSDDGVAPSQHGNILLIRVAQTQRDDLFDEDDVATTIATSERSN